MAYVLLAVAGVLFLATKAADNRPYTKRGWFPSDRVDGLLGAGWMLVVLALIASLF